MATAAGHGHGSSASSGMPSGGTGGQAALPAIGTTGLPSGPGGAPSPLGRERSSLTSLGPTPRKETSYASSSASKVSIATLPLDALEHIIEEGFKAPSRHNPKHQSAAGVAAAAGRGGRASGPIVRINPTAAPAGAAAGGGGGRASPRNWNPSSGVGVGAVAGGGGRRSHGSLGGPSFTFAAKPSTPPDKAAGGALAGALVQQPVLPGLPPGAPLALSSRAAAVLQVPESPAHLQRFIALDAAQLENHFIIASPTGTPITDLQEVLDSDASIDGLPLGRQAVVVLTTTADGVPVPRVIPVDQPVPNSLRRTGATPPHGVSYSSVPDALLENVVRSGGSSTSLAAGQASQADVGGADDGGLGSFAAAVGASFARPNGNAGTSARSLSPQRSMAASSSPHGDRGGSGGIPTPATPARRSDTGVGRAVPWPSNGRLPSASPATPASPPLRASTQQHMHGNHHHYTSSYSTLPALPGDGGGGGAAAVAAARRSAPPRRGSASPMVRREASAEAVVQALPALARMASPDHLRAGSGRDFDMGEHFQGASGDPAAASGAGGGGGAGTWSPGVGFSGVGVGGMPPRPRSGGVISVVEGHHELSPTRTRLHARIATLQIERSNPSSQTQLGLQPGHQQGGSQQQQQTPPGQQGQGHPQTPAAPRQASPLQARPGGGGGGRGGGGGGSGVNRLLLSTLTGKELVRAALKQVENGERTLTDPFLRASTPGASETSRRTSLSSVATPNTTVGGEAPPSAEEIAAAARAEEERREAAERRQARLVKSLTMLLTTGRGGHLSRPSTAASHLSRRSSARAFGVEDKEDDDDAEEEDEEEEDDGGDGGGAKVEEQAGGADGGGGAATAAAGGGASVARPSSDGAATPRQRPKPSRLQVPNGDPAAAAPSPRAAAAPSPRGTAAGAPSPKATAATGASPKAAAGGSLASPKAPSPKPTGAAAAAGGGGGGGGKQPQPPPQPHSHQPQSAKAAAAKGTARARIKRTSSSGCSSSNQVGGSGSGTAAGGGGAGGGGSSNTAAAAAAAEADTLEAAVAIAADGGLDPRALVEFAQQLDQAIEEFRLVEAARERARRLDALLTQAQLASTNPSASACAARRRITGDGGGGGGSGDAGGEGGGGGGGGAVSSPERLPPDLYLLAKRREGGKPHNVTQVISALEAPLDRPMEVDLDQLLSAIGEAIAADEQELKATRFDETFRIRTERYLGQLCRLNPAAFEEVSAAQAEADYRSSVERAKLRLRQLHGEVAGEPLTSAGKPRNQYDKAVVMLQAHRPFFLPPVKDREAVERAPVPPVLGGRGNTRPPWDVYASIFRERKRSDARDVYDTDAVLAAQFHLDWSRTVTKMLFMKLVAREDLGVRGKSGRQALEQELNEVRDALAESFGLIRCAFIYFSIATPEEVYNAALSAAVAATAAAGGSTEAAAAEVAANFTAAAARRGAPLPAVGGGSAAAGGSAAGAGCGRAAAAAASLSSRSAAAAAEAAAAAAAGPPPSLADSERAVSAAAAAAAAAGGAGGGGAAGGYGILEMDEQRWLAFCTSAGLTGRAVGVRVGDLRTLFWTVNREEERNMTLESQENNDYAFMRFEFMEALVRAAFGRYITSGALRDASDATRRLMDDLRASLPPIARLDPNEFRRTRLYTAEMEVAVVHNLELLTASFKLYKARDRAKYLSIDHWMSFLETNKLLAPHMGGISPTEAQLMFAWSQMVVVDELKLRRRAVGLQLWDFVEAVARLSERVSLPPTDEMDKWMLYNLNIGRHTPLPPGHTRVWTYCNALATGRGGPGLDRRASGRDLPSAPTPSRPLASKFRLLMEYLAGSLAVAWGGANSHETAQSMMRTANMLCGGVELA
ncbi:hypothetical protein PLESTB_001520500 [Pleodorina starrii]|uniref:Uncharacterized protein n=1 Tax=Pleodorina starrii TaxID=330485 RepID=A0A9W6F8G8_9CHLO|nr:hypothetical protein PLESTB_001520500 [Pleodorina starrii]